MNPAELRDLVEIRPASDTDRGFIRQAWATGHRKSKQAKHIARGNFDPWMWRTMDRVLEQPQTKTLVAAKPDSDFLYGFVVWTSLARMPLIHWIHIKQPFRGFGLGRRLLQEAGVGAGPIAFTFWGAESQTSSLLDKFESAEFVPVEEFLR